MDFHHTGKPPSKQGPPYLLRGSVVLRQAYTIDGQRRLTKEWYARVQFQGKRQFFPLGTPNKAAAAAKARQIFLFLTVNG
jgi:hypothetical protein